MKYGSLFFFLLSFHLSQPGGWSILVGRNRWNTMKYSSSAGRFMRTELTKLKALKTTMGATISTLGLVGTLAIYKKNWITIRPIWKWTNGNNSISNFKSQIKNKWPKIKKPFYHWCPPPPLIWTSCGLPLLFHAFLLPVSAPGAVFL